MTICFLAPSNSAHTVKWCHYFVAKGHDVHVVSFSPEVIKGTTCHYVSTGADAEGRDANKLKYLLKAREVRQIVRSINPDIINAHYATSYGTVAALAGLKNYILSVWGSDIYDFPQKSPLHKALLKYSLRKATYLFSTSRAMAEEASKYTKKTFVITPFGVDMDLFNPDKRTREENDGKFIVGTVKGLSYTYGIDYLLKAVAIIRESYPSIPIELRIAGKGKNEVEFKQLAAELRISDITHWLGFISQEEAATEWANMDVAVIPSVQESFGVAAVEAQACGTAVIISDVPGLKEATKPGFSSVVVQKSNSVELSKEIAWLYNNPMQRSALGKNGRDFAENFELLRCFEQVEELLEGYNKNL